MSKSGGVEFRAGSLHSADDDVEPRPGRISPLAVVMVGGDPGRIEAIRDWLGGVDWPAKVRVAVDVDPYSFV